MGYKLGLEAFVHYDTSGVDAATWLDADNVEEVNLNLERAEAEIKNRGSDWVKYLTGLLAAGIEITMTYNGGAADYEAFRDAFINGSVIGVAVMTDDIANDGAEGLVADMRVVSMARGEPLEESQTMTFTLRPAADSPTDTEPAWQTTVVP